ncbi:unannotated protein [freshwater metagenome]|uniref:Unannotated protein n=1 Tax=freshwater metagenome TaxID=449393 RepID=A0A6J7D2A6_9ZZZZ
MADREAVRLVAHLLQQLESGGLVRKQHRRAATGEENLLDALGERGHGDPALAEILEHLQAGRELTAAAIDHDQARQRGERLVVGGIVRAELRLALPVADPAREHLAHRGEVVGDAILQRADVELAVVALLRRATLEDHHRGDGVGAHEVRDVEALDPQRQHVEPQRLLELVQRLDPALATALGLQAVGLQREPGVALRELQQLALVTALGGAHLDA